MKAVTFIGHGDAVSCNREKIKASVINLIEKCGSREFFFGGMGDFDRICAHILWELKKEYGFLKTYLVVPYLTFRIDQPLYYDEIIFPHELEGVFFKKCILLRNRYLVDHADAAVCYVNHSWGGAYKTYQYAKRKGLYLINIEDKS